MKRQLKKKKIKRQHLYVLCGRSPFDFWSHRFSFSFFVSKVVSFISVCLCVNLISDFTVSDSAIIQMIPTVKTHTWSSFFHLRVTYFERRSMTQFQKNSTCKCFLSYQISWRRTLCCLSISIIIEKLAIGNSKVSLRVVLVYCRAVSMVSLFCNTLIPDDQYYSWLLWSYSARGITSTTQLLHCIWWNSLSLRKILLESHGIEKYSVTQNVIWRLTQ